jgi:hypothetical protein
MISMLCDLAGHLRRKPCGSDRFEHGLAQVRKCIQHGGDKHIARHAADGIEVEVHGVTLDKSPLSLDGRGLG